MAFFDELGKKISQTSQGVVQKTKDTAEILKLNGMVSDEEKRIKNLYQEIGKVYVESHAEDFDPAFGEMIAGINDAKAKIAEYTEQVKRLKGVVLCPICGGDVPYGAPFCSACGSKLNAQEQTNDAANNVSRCANCGVPLKDGSAFCTNCGTKVAAPAAPAARVCANCGKTLEATSNFCTNCGTKFEG